MISTPEFLTTAPRYLFFTGKGGVGKTSVPTADLIPLASDRESGDPGFRCGTFADCFGGRLLACFDREQRLKLRTWSCASRSSSCGGQRPGSRSSAASTD